MTGVALISFPLILVEYFYTRERLEYVSVGLSGKDKYYIAIWRTRDREDECITLKMNRGIGKSMRCGYPEKKDIRYQVTEEGIRVYLESKTASIFISGGLPLGSLLP